MTVFFLSTKKGTELRVGADAARAEGGPGEGRRRDRVKSTGTERIAPGDAEKGQCGAADGPVPADSLGCVTGAGRFEPAGGQRSEESGENRGNKAAVEVDGCEQTFGGQADEE